MKKAQRHRVNTDNSLGRPDDKCASHTKPFGRSSKAGQEDAEALLVVGQREHSELASASTENPVLVVVSLSQEVCASIMLDSSLITAFMISLRSTASLFSLSSASIL